MIAGTRQKTIGGTAYRNDPLYAFGKAFTEAANDILTVENFDLFAEPSRAIRSTGAKESLKEFFCNNFVDDNNTYLSAEELEDLHEDAENMLENDINAIQENAYMSQYAPMVGMALPIHKLILMNNAFSQGNVFQIIGRAKFVALKKQLNIAYQLFNIPGGVMGEVFDLTSQIEKKYSNWFKSGRKVLKRELNRQQEKDDDSSNE